MGNRHEVTSHHLRYCSQRAIGDRNQINLLFVSTKQTSGSTNSQASDGRGGHCTEAVHINN
jgi:hypothetical protein